MAKTYVKDQVEYTASNHRMRYNPEYHENHQKAWTLKDVVYLCSMWHSMKKADIAAALGRTHGTVLSKAQQLRNNGTFNKYKEMGEEL